MVRGWYSEQIQMEKLKSPLISKYRKITVNNKISHVQNNNLLFRNIPYLLFSILPYFIDRIKGVLIKKDEDMNNLIELQDVNLIRNGKSPFKRD